MVEVVYKPRKPKTSSLYQSIAEHFAEFESVYEERYQNKYGVLRDVVREVVDKYLGCGDLRKALPGSSARSASMRFFSPSPVRDATSAHHVIKKEC
jgi:hypothetical protein